MPYVTRNADNTIAQFSRNAPPSSGWEQIADDDPAVAAFLEAIANPIAPVVPDWQALETALRQTDIFATAFTTTNGNAWALLLASFHSNDAASSPGRLADFQFAIAQIRKGLAQDFSADQISRFNALLTEYHFPFQVQTSA